MNTFRIGYKSYFHETSEHHSDYVQAKTEFTALKTFAKEHRIPGASRLSPDKWEWWDCEYLYQFRVVERVGLVPCIYCDGNGKFPVDYVTTPQ